MTQLKVKNGLIGDLIENVVANFERGVQMVYKQKKDLHLIFKSRLTTNFLDEFLFFSRMVETIFLYQQIDSLEWKCCYKKRFDDSFLLPDHVDGSVISIVIPFAPFWKREHEEKLLAIQDTFEVTRNEKAFFESLVVLALSYADTIHPGLHRKLSIVCGPISTGPGTKKEKLITFKKGIYLLENNPGKNSLILNQMPFEEVFNEYHEWVSLYKSENKIIPVFYEEIFESGVLNKSYMLPHWEQSEGASWENEKSKKLNFSIIDIEKEKPIVLEHFWEQFYNLNRHTISF
ncbi:hypothetical protein IT403_00990 [Candidatus Nomurabacteria bacterium]|nr:hypothetical protein [Candidatus Nomurabacteria bacterium]